MKEQFNVSLLASLEQLSTPQLNTMLQSELEKELPDEYAVRLILKVLRNRESDYPVVFNEQIDDAWKKYERKIQNTASSFKKSLVKAAVILVLCSMFLFTLPQEANATSFFDRIAAWTESVFQLFSRSDLNNSQNEYIFQTEHPGLQKLYDEVTKLGVTSPVVPMWLDLEYNFNQYKITTTPTTTKILAIFDSGNNEAVFEMNIYSSNIPREFHKDVQQAKKYERNEIRHYIFQNRDLWTVVWAQDNIECSLYISCQEDVLYRILDSIYTLEE